MTERVVSLYRIRDIMRKTGADAHVWMTGGGVHTLYAGPEVNFYTAQQVTEARYTLIAGPTNWDGESSPSEICYGPNDDGIAKAQYLPANATETQIADIFLAYIREHSPK